MTSRPPHREMPHTALLVEDEDTVLDLMRAWLEALGFDVTVTRNGREGLERFRAASGNFDLLVSDLVMPEVGGREMIEQMRSVVPDLPVLITSGAGRGSVEELLEQPAIDFLAKPFRAAEFKEAVQALLSLAGNGSAPAAARDGRRRNKRAE